MVYNYLLDLYQVLAERKMEIERLSKEPSDDSLEIEKYRKGQLLAVNDFHGVPQKKLSRKTAGSDAVRVSTNTPGAFPLAISDTKHLRFWDHKKRLWD
jgi:hypothetical protein